MRDMLTLELKPVVPMASEELDAMQAWRVRIQGKNQVFCSFLRHLELTVVDGNEIYRAECLCGGWKP